MYLLYRGAGDLYVSEVQGGAHPLPDELLYKKGCGVVPCRVLLGHQVVEYPSAHATLVHSLVGWPEPIHCYCC